MMVGSGENRGRTRVRASAQPQRLALMTALLLCASPPASAQDAAPVPPTAAQSAPSVQPAPVAPPTPASPPAIAAPATPDVPAAADPGDATRSDPNASAPPSAGAEAGAPSAPVAVAPDAVAPDADASAPAPTPAPGAAASGGHEALPMDLSPLGMYRSADIVVKSVMISLALASLATWTVWLAKLAEILAGKFRLRRTLRVIVAADDLGAARAALAARRGPAADMVRAAVHEAGASAAAVARAGGQGLLGRVASHLGRIEAAAGRRMSFGTGLLATIGAIAPFVGLFGTVWGIMNSFIGISRAQTTNLAVVAPGIAEALLATALGLVAAIPAVVIYNALTRSIGGYRALLADAAAAVERLVSRDLDHRRLEAGAHIRAAE